jgi:hypothetical protein
VFKKGCGGPAAAPIRDAQAWTGAAHPQLGNSLNMRVRDAAKEALEEVFKLGPPPSAAQAPVTGAGAAPSLRGRIQGYGSTTNSKIVDTYSGNSGSYASVNGLVRNNGAGSQSGTGGARGRYGGFGSEDVRAAEASGTSWRSAADNLAVCLPYA